MYAKLAWRNIWRNPKRTLVILLAVIIGVWNMVFSNAFMRGMLEQMVENGVSTLTGYILIQDTKYVDDPVVENTITDPGAVRKVLRDTLPAGARFAERIKVGGVISNARHSSGITIVGIEPEEEKGVSFIANAVVSGRYLEAGEKNGILIGRALLDDFGSKIGHRLVVMSQGMDKQIESAAFKVVGVFDSELESTQKQYVFVPRKTLARMIGVDGGASEFSVMLDRRKDAKPISLKIASSLDPAKYSVRWWEQALPLLKAYVGMFNGFIFVWSVIIFAAMSFGIVNTLLMAVYERIKEFGLLKALGMKPPAVLWLVMTESVFLLVCGIGMGSLLGWATVGIFAKTGINLSAFGAGAEFAGMSKIVYPELVALDMVGAVFIVFFLGLFISVYPAWKASRITPIDAMERD